MKEEEPPAQSEAQAAARNAPKAGHNGFWLKVGRIEALSDGIFAISMTLLVLSLDIPDVNQHEASERLWDVLSDNTPMFEDYALSFFLLANFWLMHHRQFSFIRRIDERFLWQNILVLMFVALVPFSTEVMSTYDNAQTAALIFEGNLLAIGVVYYSMWHYATAGYRLVDRTDLSPAGVTSTRIYNLVLPIISLIAIAFSFLSPSWSEAIYLLVPVAVFTLHRLNLVKPLQKKG